MRHPPPAVRGPRRFPLLGLAVMLGSLVPAAARAQDGGTPAVVPAEQDAILEAADRARSKGADAAPIRIVEVADFECPFCAQYHRETYPIVDSLYVKTGLARYLWVSFPNARHPRAWPAIEAAFCAGAAGRFWEMHGILFATREEWMDADDPRSRFVEYAGRAGIEPASFTACLRNDQTAPLQVSDYDSALRSGITSTPFFVVGDSLAIQGAVDADRFRAAVDSVLAARGVSAP